MKPVIRIAGRDEAKRANKDIKAYAENWLKGAPKSDQEIFETQILREMFEQGMSEAFRH